MSKVQTKNRPVKVAGYSSDTLNAKRNLRRLEAEARATERAKLTPAQKVALCNARPGASACETERLTGKRLKFGVYERDRFHLKG